MSEQPEALRLADLIEWTTVQQDLMDAAAELRRLHAVNAELLDALQTVVANAPDPYCAITRFIDAQCRAAIAKATGEQQ